MFIKVQLIGSLYISRFVTPDLRFGWCRQMRGSSVMRDAESETECGTVTCGRINVAVMSLNDVPIGSHWKHGVPVPRT
jgi:hypothetical protein